MESSHRNPKYWGVFSILYLMKFLSVLPFSWLKIFAIVLGFVIKPFLKKRNRIARINLRIAFPEKSEKEIRKLVRQSYRSLVLSGAECIAAWMYSERKFNKISIEFENSKLFNEIHQDPKKTLLVLGFHFHTLEIAGRFTGQHFKPFTVMYQKNENSLLEDLIKDYREKNIYKCLDSKNFISVIKSMKKHVSMWYAPDQDFGLEASGLKNSVFAPFFNKPCLTLTVTPWLAQKTGATVLPAYYIRKPNNSGYKIIIGDPLEFTGDIYKDAEITNIFLEEAIRKYPEQYLWQHRRYRTRPDGESQIY